MPRTPIRGWNPKGGSGKTTIQWKKPTRHPIFVFRMRPSQGHGDSRERGDELFKEHQQVVLTADVSGDGGEQLRPGDVVTIIHVHPGGEAYVVEFATLDGDTVDIATVLPSQTRPVTSRDLTHARQVETAV